MIIKTNIEEFFVNGRLNVELHVRAIEGQGYPVGQCVSPKYIALEFVDTLPTDAVHIKTMQIQTNAIREVISNRLGDFPYRFRVFAAKKYDHIHGIFYNETFIQVLE